MSVQGANSTNGASGVPAPASSALRNKGMNPLNFLRGSSPTKQTAPATVGLNSDPATAIFSANETTTISEKADMASQWSALKKERAEMPTEKVDAEKAELSKAYDTKPTGDEKTDQRNQACSTAFNHIKNTDDYKNLSGDEQKIVQNYIVKQAKENAVDNPNLSKEALTKGLSTAHEINLINQMNEVLNKVMTPQTDDKDNVTSIKPDVDSTKETIKQFGNPDLHKRNPEIKKSFENYEKLSEQMGLKGKDVTEDNALQHSILMSLSTKTDNLTPETQELLKTIGKEMSNQKFNAVYTALVPPKQEHADILEMNKQYLREGDEKPELNQKEKDIAKGEIVGEGKKYSKEEWDKLSPTEKDDALTKAYDDHLKENIVGEGKPYSEEDWKKFSADDKKQLLENKKLFNRIGDNKLENADKFRNDFREKLSDEDKKKFDEMTPENKDKFIKEVLGKDIDTSDPTAKDELKNLDSDENKQKMKDMFAQLPGMGQNAINDYINGLSNQEATFGKKQMDGAMQAFNNENGAWHQAASGIDRAANACVEMGSLLSRMRQRMMDNANQRWAAKDQQDAQRQQQLQQAQRATGTGAQ